MLLASTPALYLPPRMESDGNNYKPILYLHCCPAQQHPSVPATDFPVSPFHSLSKVSTNPPLWQLRGPSPVCCPKVGLCALQRCRQGWGTFRQQLHSPTRCGLETNHNLHVVPELSRSCAQTSPDQAGRWQACPPSACHHHSPHGSEVACKSSCLRGAEQVVHRGDFMALLPGFSKHCGWDTVQILF